jgi:hypothetical protein
VNLTQVFIEAFRVLGIAESALARGPKLAWGSTQRDSAKMPIGPAN